MPEAKVKNKFINLNPCHRPILAKTEGLVKVLVINGAACGSRTQEFGKIVDNQVYLPAFTGIYFR